ncbi:MAG: PIN domain-containing protein [Terriglobia bacterium]|jgi:predicted nucleic acid-binding protein
MRRLLVDTDVASYIFKWHPLAPRYVELMADNEVLISFVTLAEMRLGALKSHWGFRKISLLEKYLSRFSVCYPDDRLCSGWAEVKHESNRGGHPIASQDAWIAATARYLDAPLVTNNTKHYAHLKNLEILTDQG